MSILALMAIAAGSVAMPDPAGNPNAWLDPFDFPESAVRAGESGTIFYKALVAPDGKVEQCRVQASSAAPADWEKFCNHVKRRFSFGTVKDPQGAPAYYVLEDNYAFVLPDTWVRNAAKPDPNLVIDVAKLPGAQDGRIDLYVNVAVDAAGKLQQCNGAASAGQATLSRLACEQLSANWAPMPERNAAGQPVNYIRQMQVEFRTAPAGG